MSTSFCIFHFFPLQNQGGPGRGGVPPPTPVRHSNASLPDPLTFCRTPPLSDGGDQGATLGPMRPFGARTQTFGGTGRHTFQDVLVMRQVVARALPFRRVDDPFPCASAQQRRGCPHDAGGYERAGDGWHGAHDCDAGGWTSWRRRRLRRSPTQALDVSSGRTKAFFF